MWSGPKREGFSRLRAWARTLILVKTKKPMFVHLCCSLFEMTILLTFILMDESILRMHTFLQGEGEYNAYSLPISIRDPNPSSFISARLKSAWSHTNCLQPFITCATHAGCIHFHREGVNKSSPLAARPAPSPHLDDRTAKRSSNFPGIFGAKKPFFLDISGPKSQAQKVFLTKIRHFMRAWKCMAECIT